MAIRQRDNPLQILWDRKYGLATIPTDQKEFVEISCVRSQRYPRILTKQIPITDADSWNGKPKKKSLYLVSKYGGVMHGVRVFYRY